MGERGVRVIVTVQPRPVNSSLIQVDPKMVPKLPAYLRHENIDPIKPYHKAVKLGLLSGGPGMQKTKSILSYLRILTKTVGHVSGGPLKYTQEAAVRTAPIPEQKSISAGELVTYCMGKLLTSSRHLALCTLVAKSFGTQFCSNVLMY